MLAGENNGQLRVLPTDASEASMASSWSISSIVLQQIDRPTPAGQVVKCLGLGVGVLCLAEVAFLFTGYGDICVVLTEVEALLTLMIAAVLAYNHFGYDRLPGARPLDDQRLHTVMVRHSETGEERRVMNVRFARDTSPEQLSVMVLDASDPDPAPHQWSIANTI